MLQEPSFTNAQMDLRLHAIFTSDGSRIITASSDCTVKVNSSALAVSSIIVSHLDSLPLLPCNNSLVSLHRSGILRRQIVYKHSSRHLR